MTTTTNETTVEADPRLPTIRIVREFEAPPERVYRAYTDPDLFVRWLVRDGTTVRLDAWHAVSGGRYRYTIVHGTQEIVTFWGSFHQLREPDLIIQTQSMAGAGDGAVLNTVTFADLDGRTRLTDVTLADSFEARDMILASGMEKGVIAGHEELDKLLAD